jgi:hypothetical protein
MPKGRPLSPLMISAADRNQLIHWSRRDKTAHGAAMRFGYRLAGRRSGKQHGHCWSTAHHAAYSRQVAASFSGMGAGGVGPHSGIHACRHHSLIHALAGLARWTERNQYLSYSGGPFR